MRDSREPTPVNASSDVQDPDAAAELLAAQLRAARHEAGLSQQVLAEMMRGRGFSWRQTTVAKSESAARPVLFTEVVALSWALGKPVDYFLKPPDTLEAVVEESEKRLYSARRRLQGMEVQLAALRFELTREECANGLATAARDYRASYDSGVLRHDLDRLCSRFGKRLVDYDGNDAYKAIPISRNELEVIDKEALTAVAEMTLRMASSLSDKEIEEDGAEILNGASLYIESGNADSELLDEFRAVEQWEDLVCFRLVDLFVERISK
jgi:transcriptional regulator with XRE-family HTH domain